jgi:hypothetical protein
MVWFAFGVLACLCFGLLVSLCLQGSGTGVQALLVLIMGFGWQYIQYLYNI